MKNIYFRILSILVLLPLLSACTDELGIPGNYPEGEESVVYLDISTADFDALTRAEGDNPDKKINTLWVGIYNASSGVRTGSLFVERGGEVIPDHKLRKIKVSALSGLSYIVAVANYKFRPVAMGGSTELRSMEEALGAADTWEKFRSISAFFAQDGSVNISQPLNPYLMSGYFVESLHSDGSRPEFKAVDIRPGVASLSGAVHLRRLISHVKFNITFNAANVKSAVVKSWQACNIPNTAWIHERVDSDPERNAPDVLKKSVSYTATPEMADLSVNGTTYSFDFWQLENRRTGRPLPAKYNNAADAYKYREKEYKNPDGSNSGKYESLVESIDSDDANSNAGFVRFRVQMEMTVDEEGKPLPSGIATRLVDTEYVVHLGYCEGSGNMEKALDFNCRRNTKYTYNVRINNVSDVMVEATSSEFNPAVEGIVSDISNNFYSVDAHYAAFNIQLTSQEISKFQYYIVAPGMDGNDVVINSMDAASVPASDSDDRFKYLSWIELRPTDSQTVLAEYKPRSGANADGKTYLLSELSEKKPAAGWYTLFVNEYVYETGTHANGNELESLNWQKYVNKPDRRAWLNVSGNVSADGASIHYVSKYALSQKSIQTYYNGHSSSSGLGVEHDNESLGLNLRNGFNPHQNASGTELDKNTTAGRNRLSGRFNLAQYIAGSTDASLSWTDDRDWDRYGWAKYVDFKAPQTINTVNNQNIYIPARTQTSPVPLPAIKERSDGNEYGISGKTGYDPDQSTNPKYIEAITACMNRNRDLDGDGQISADELRWFVPTTAQYVSIILGRRSLVTPLVDVDNLERLPNNSGMENGVNSSLLFYASDGRMMWAMEGLSDSEWREWTAYCAAPWEVRCVRNLGSDQTVINSTNVTTPAFVLRSGTNIVDLTHCDSKSIREEAYHFSWLPMPVHHIYDQRYNRCYRSFEFFDSIIPLNDARLGLSGKTIEWASYLASNNPCKVLDYTGKSGWRVPNQKELMILGILGVSNRNVPSGTKFSVTCSYSYFDFEGYSLGNNPSDPGGTISSAYRFPMKIIPSSAQATQSEAMNNITINSAYYGVRCVRDVD